MQSCAGEHLQTLRHSDKDLVVPLHSTTPSESKAPQAQALAGQGHGLAEVGSRRQWKSEHNASSRAEPGNDVLEGISQLNRGQKSTEEESHQVENSKAGDTATSQFQCVPSSSKEQEDRTSDQSPDIDLRGGRKIGSVSTGQHSEIESLLKQGDIAQSGSDADKGVAEASKNENSKAGGTSKQGGYARGPAGSHTASDTAINSAAQQAIKPPIDADAVLHGNEGSDRVSSQQGASTSHSTPQQLGRGQRGAGTGVSPGWLRDTRINYQDTSGWWCLRIQCRESSKGFCNKQTHHERCKYVYSLTWYIRIRAMHCLRDTLACKRHQ